MDNETLKTKITELLAAVVYDETGEWLSLAIDPKDWLLLATRLRNDESLYFDYLFCVTCIDWKTHLTMVYHLSSTRHRYSIVVKANLDRASPAIETVSHIWKTAEFHEREVYEMFGVDFLNHPDTEVIDITRWMGRKTADVKRF